MKLSIITINYNNSKGLRKTMESVLKQTYRDFEYIIVDGASTDGSVEVIREYVEKAESQELRVKSIIWTSEPDTGIYNAMNKGIEIALGRRVVNAFNHSERSEDKSKELPEYLLMLNSGDYLVNEYVLERIMPELHTDGVIQGGMYLYQMKEECLDYGNGLTDMSFYDVVDGDFLHQADFVRRDVYERYGYYDESYKIGGDTAFFIRTLGFHDISFRCIQIPISFFEGGGMASGKDERCRKLQMYESKRIEDELLGPRIAKLYREDRAKVRSYEMLSTYKWSRFLMKLILYTIRIFNSR